MSLCLLQVISAAGVVHDSASGVLLMEPTEKTKAFMVVAEGNTYRAREDLKSLGFKWNREHGWWYHRMELTAVNCKHWIEGLAEHFGPGVQFGLFERIDNG